MHVRNVGLPPAARQEMEAETKHTLQAAPGSHPSATYSSSSEDVSCAAAAASKSLPLLAPPPSLPISAPDRCLPLPAAASPSLLSSRLMGCSFCRAFAAAARWPRCLPPAVASVHAVRYQVVSSQAQHHSTAFSRYIAADCTQHNTSDAVWPGARCAFHVNTNKHTWRWVRQSPPVAAASAAGLPSSSEEEDASAAAPFLPRPRPFPLPLPRPLPAAAALPRPRPLSRPPLPLPAGSDAAAAPEQVAIHVGV